MEDKSAVMQGFRSSEIHIFLLFPISTIIGLSLAYKWPKLGGAITLIGIIGLMLFRPDLCSNPYFLFGITPPAILYFVYGTLEQRRLSKAESVEKLQWLLIEDYGLFYIDNMATILYYEYPRILMQLHYFSNSWQE